eukprot:scaffold6971_cov105-Pinguiococcus_pyrenoidosus.AAC.1
MFPDGLARRCISVLFRFVSPQKRAKLHRLCPLSAAAPSLRHASCRTAGDNAASPGWWPSLGPYEEVDNCKCFFA